VLSSEKNFLPQAARWFTRLFMLRGHARRRKWGKNGHDSSLKRRGTRAARRPNAITSCRMEQQRVNRARCFLAKLVREKKLLDRKR
jgi:hypothetical protein